MLNLTGQSLFRVISNKHNIVYIKLELVLPTVTININISIRNKHKIILTCLINLCQLNGFKITIY